MRIQPRAPIKKTGKFVCLDDITYALVKEAAREFDSSLSWVIHTAVADFFKVDIKRFNEGLKNAKRLNRGRKGQSPKRVRR